MASTIDLDALNPQQREGTTHYEGPTMILAGAGTGKTRVITSRIVYMLDSGVEASSVAAMTFTNKAAREMRERIFDMTSKSRAKRLTIGTFHSFCLYLMRQYPKKFGLEKGFSLVGTSDQIDLVRRALDEKHWSGLYKADDILYQIGICKNWLLSPNQVLDPPSGIAGKIKEYISDPALVSVCYELYERQLRLNSAIDFDDCIFKVVKALENDSELREKLQKRFRYILVDEFQDTNFAQFSILSLLAGPDKNVCVVGDDDQSIYSWRGAMYETLEKFRTEFQPKIIKLEQNYRCTNVILNAANTIIKNNRLRMDKTLWSNTASEVPIDLIAHEDAIAESNWIAQKIISILGRGHKPIDIAILYRANAQAKSVEMALREAGIPYKTFGGQSFFERKEVKDCLSYLRLISNPDDHMALWRVINTPTRGIGLKTQERIAEIAKRLGRSPFSVIEDSSLRDEFSTREASAIHKFVQTLLRVKNMQITDPSSFANIAEAICTEFQLVEHIKQTSKNPLSKQSKIEALKAIPRWLKKSAEDMIADEGTLDSYRLLDRLTLSETPHDSDSDEKPNYVSLMTIHSSKGLEFPMVFLTGLEEGLLPHKNSTANQNSIDEERRLFYVAITRAKQKLHLSYAHLRQSGYQKEFKKPSRFLTELPSDGVDSKSLEQHLAAEKNQAEVRKKSTISRLSSLRQSIKDGTL